MISGMFLDEARLGSLGTSPQGGWASKSRKVGDIYLHTWILRVSEPNRPQARTKPARTGSWTSTTCKTSKRSCSRSWLWRRARHDHMSMRSPTLGLQIAQSRSDLYTSGREGGGIYILGKLGKSKQSCNLRCRNPDHAPQRWEPRACVVSWAPQNCFTGFRAIRPAMPREPNIV